MTELWLGWAVVDATAPGNWTPAMGRAVSVAFENRLEAVAPMPFASIAAVTENQVVIGVHTVVAVPVAVPLPPAAALLAPALVALVAVRSKRTSPMTNTV